MGSDARRLRRLNARADTVATATRLQEAHRSARPGWYAGQLPATQWTLAVLRLAAEVQRRYVAHAERLVEMSV